MHGEIKVKRSTPLYVKQFRMIVLQISKLIIYIYIYIYIYIGSYNYSENQFLLLLNMYSDKVSKEYSCKKFIKSVLNCLILHDNVFICRYHSNLIQVVHCSD
jgi:hypothetical protein